MTRIAPQNIRRALIFCPQYCFGGIHQFSFLLFSLKRRIRLLCDQKHHKSLSRHSQIPIHLQWLLRQYVHDTALLLGASSVEEVAESKMQ